MGVDNTVDRGICPLNFALQRQDGLFCALVVKSRMGFIFTHVGLFVTKISSALNVLKLITSGANYLVRGGVASN